MTLFEALALGVLIIASWTFAAALYVAIDELVGSDERESQVCWSCGYRRTTLGPVCPQCGIDTSENGGEEA